MTDTLIPQSSAPVPAKDLLARMVGVVFAPRQTYAEVAARPRVLGVLLAVLVIMGAATFAFMSTDVGRTAVLDAQFSRMESIGRPMTDAQAAQMERMAPFLGYITVVSLVISVPLISLLTAGVGLAIFNAGLGGNATFKQVYAVVAHSYVLPALQVLFVLPLNYARESLSSSTSLAIFFPMLDDTTFVMRLLGQVDLFRIWWVVSLAIGFGVLYKRKTAPIAWGFLGIYGVIALIIAGVMTALSGA